LDIFAAKADPARFAEIRPLAVVILRFVAAYCVLDTMNIIMASALKGAGDTRFVMFTSVTLGWVVMVIPTWIFCGRPGGSIYLAWVFLTAYVNLTGIIYLARFLHGKWRSMRVIEFSSPVKPATEMAGE
jgi:MATE family multidrug resistance protein